MAMEKSKELVLFGGDNGWNADDWTSSDDRVRGGSSQSYLDTTSSTAKFHGTLDTSTLGGAGFASQRTTSSKSWDLSTYTGIHLSLGKTDGKKYTFILKDEILPPDPNTGREQSTISWEYDFTHAGAEGLYVPWGALKATYRGKEKNDAGDLKKGEVKRFSIMCRSFFDQQAGDFELYIKEVKAVCLPEDLERGIASGSNKKEAWSWKNSNLVGLGVILGTTWAFCFGFCWWKGIDTSHMTFSRWWRITGRKGLGV